MEPQNDPRNEPTYRTSDLRLAAYLLTRGLRCIRADDTPNGGGRAVFVLSPRPDPNDVTAYGEGRAVAEVNALADALRELKSKIYMRGGRR